MAKNDTRLGRINEELRKEISHIISFELKDPNLTGLISVTRAKITPDLKYAKVYVSILNAKSEEKTMKALQYSEGFIRTQIARTINLRINPQIIFEKDDSIEYGAKIDSSKYCIIFCHFFPSSYFIIILSFNLFHNKNFYDVSFFQIIIIFYLNTTFISFCYFFCIIFKSF